MLFRSYSGKLFDYAMTLCEAVTDHHEERFGRIRIATGKPLTYIGVRPNGDPVAREIDPAILLTTNPRVYHTDPARTVRLMPQPPVELQPVSARVGGGLHIEADGRVFVFSIMATRPAIEQPYAFRICAIRHCIRLADHNPPAVPGEPPGV